MSSISEQQFNDLLGMANKAKTDNEKFAALLAISKMTSGDTLGKEKRKKLFDTIGLQFPIRLLLSSFSADADESNRQAFASIGLNALMAFCSDEEMLQGEDILQAVPHLLKTAHCFTKKDSYNKLVMDCLDCFTVIIMNRDCPEELIDHEIIQLLCEIESSKVDNKSIELLVSLLIKNEEIWENNFTLLNDFLHEKALKFKSDQTETKIHLCKELFQVICTISNSIIEGDFHFSWKKDVLYGLKEILCSKISANLRNPALLLASETLRLFGWKAFFKDQTEENFPVILLRLACIEAGLFFMKLETDKDTMTQDEISLLVACCSIIESFCSCIADFDQDESNEIFITFEQIKMSQSSLSDVMNSFSQFISTTLEKQDISGHQKHCLISSIRAMSSWLNIEHNLLSAQGIDLLPIILQILKFIMQNDELNLLKITLPIIMISLEHNEPRKLIFENNILQIMKDILSLTFERCTATQLEDFGTQEALHFALQTFIGLCTSLSDEECQRHKDLLHEVHSSVTNIEISECPLTTRAYLSTLMLVIVNEFDQLEQNFKLESSLKAVVEFMKNAYSLDSRDGSINHDALYQMMWGEVGQLWMMSMQELTKSIKKFEVVRSFIVKSNWASELPEQRDAAKGSSDIELASLFSNLTEAIS